MADGFASTTVDKVADLLGCTKGFIYYQFKNKTDLFLEVHLVTMQTNLAILRPICEGSDSPTVKLRKMVEAHVAAITDRLPYQRVSVMGIDLHMHGSSTPPQRKVMAEIVRMHREYEALFVSVLADGINSGEFRQADPKRMVKAMLGALNWMPMWFRPARDGTAANKQEIATEMCEFVMRGTLNTVLLD